MTIEAIGPAVVAVAITEVGNHVTWSRSSTVWYNFIRVHKSLCTSPVMAAGVADTLWSMDDLVAMMDAEAPKLVR